MENLNIHEIQDNNDLKNVIFEGTQQIREHEWLTSMNALELGKLWDEGKIEYYGDTQRGYTTKRDKDGNLVKTPVFSVKHVNEIEKSMSRGTYFPDILTINVLQDGTDQLEYDESSLLLNIIKGKICILDGQHRLRAVHKLYTNYKILDGEVDLDLESIVFPIKITNYDVDTAGQQFFQYTLGLKISTSKAESFNKMNAANRIATALNTTGVLKGKIDTNKNSIAKSDDVHVVTFATLVNAIKDSFRDIPNKKEEDDVLRFLQDFFEELVKIYPEIVNDDERKLSKEYMFTCENIFFYGYIQLARELYRARKFGWKDRLKNIKKIDFTKSHDNWKFMVRETKNNAISITNNKSTRIELREKLLDLFIAAENED